MPHFRYLAFDPSGRREAGTVEASTSDLAWARLIGLGLTVVKLESETDAHVGRAKLRLSFTGGSIPLSEQADLASQLAILFGAGLSVLETLRIAGATARSSKIKQILGRVHQLVEGGQQLPDAFASAGQDLSPLFVSIVRVGMMGGLSDDRFPQLLTGLALTLRRNEQMTSRMGNALVYPIVLLIGGVLVFLLMTMLLAPQLASIFQAANKPVPVEVGMFIEVGEFLESYGPVLALILLMIVLGGFTLVRSKKRTLFRLIADIPAVGPLLRDSSLARLSGSVTLLLQAGVPLVEALKNSSVAYKDEIAAKHFADAADAVEAGRSASSVFGLQTSISPVFAELFAVGEAANSLPSVLVAATTRLEELTERRLQALISILPPAMTLFIGGLIGLLVYSVMGALLSINELAI